MSSFDKWLARYCEVNIIPEGELQGIALSCENEKYMETWKMRQYIFRQS